MRLPVTSLFFVCPALLILAPTLFARDSAAHGSEVRSPHFVVLSDANDKQAHKVAVQLEQMRSVFHTLLPNASEDTGSTITVLALKDKKSFQSIEPEAYRAKGQLDLAGYFLEANEKHFIMLRLDAEGSHPFATVYHEYTHYMLRKANAWIPLWLNEGMAEFYQNTDILDKEVLLGQPSPEDILYLRQNKLLPLTTLLTVDQSSPYYHEEQKGSVFYAESWALTHFIEVTDRQKGTNRLRDYADRLVKGEDSVVAAQEAFGDLKQLQKSLDSYIAQGQFMMFKMKSSINFDESTLQPTPITTADADAIRADVLLFNGRTQEAQALIDSTLRDDPNNALAHESQGDLKFREQDFAAAARAYGEAVKAGDHSYLANYYYAILSMQSGVSGGQDGQIQSSLETSIQQNPNFAPAYDALARAYSMTPGKGDEAHSMNVKAIQLDPGNINYRLNAASVLQNQQKYDAAVSVLQAALRVTRKPDEIATIQGRIDQIKNYQSAIQRSREAAKQSNNRETTTATIDTRSYTVTSSDGRKYEIKSDGKEAPKYPTEEPTGAHHTARGVLRSVRCFYPSVVTLNLDPAARPEPGRVGASKATANKAGASKAAPGNAEGTKDTPILLYRNDFYKIEFTALNFTPTGDINPCTDIEGLKAKVEYAEVSDKSVAGQILSIELSK